MIAKILFGLGLVFVIEGLTYALVPAQMRQMMATMTKMPPEKLRLIGTAALALGVGIVALAGLF